MYEKYGGNKFTWEMVRYVSSKLDESDNPIIHWGKHDGEDSSTVERLGADSDEGDQGRDQLREQTE